jgi:hypothetical protein
VKFFIELGHQFHRTVLVEPALTAVPHDLQEPRACVPAAKALKEPVCTDHRVLRHIFSVRPITQQPPRQVYPSIKIRQHQLLEPDSLV